MTRPRVLLGAALVTAGQGGISQVARLTALTLARRYNDLKILSLLDNVPIDFAGNRVALAHGRKTEFFARCQAAALTRTHFVFDSSGIARTNPGLGLLRTPRAVWVHGVEAWANARPAALAAIARADLLLVNSRYTLERHQTQHGERKQARVCWLATEEDDPPQRLATFEGVPTALLIGRIDLSEGLKGHAALIACWPSVISSIPNARLIFAGTGNGLHSLQREAARSPAATNIDVVGYIDAAALPDLFRRAHVYAMPSRQEGFGIAYVEAMRYGLPVIASRQDAGQEINIDGLTGFNVDLDGNKDELTAALIELLSNSDKAASLGRAAHARWREHFRFSCFAHRLDNIWSAFTGEHAPGVGEDNGNSDKALSGRK
jgi:phosphatidyl-myo-inositol dimannoside synthase